MNLKSNLKTLAGEALFLVVGEGALSSIETPMEETDYINMVALWQLV